MATTVQGREILIERVFDAPIELVWRTWTEPERIVLWWGPKDFTCPSARSDFRVGGTYLYCMRTPDGKDGWTGGVFREIVAMERIVVSDYFADEHGNKVPPSHYGVTGELPNDEGVLTITFADAGDGRTKLTLHTAVAVDEGEAEGWNESLDKFAEALKR
jgi:uncharacterized protein YndB with AHSA1/START domain